jgi:CRISPR/Cas system-associated exonuclease Cas4 (RecB family)
LKTLRASEIGTYVYCHRAWWYHRQGIQPENQAELAAGSELHERHGRAVMVSGCLQTAAYVLLLAALIALTIYLIGQLVG